MASATVVVVAVVILSLLLLGVIPGWPRSSGMGSSVALSYQSAKAKADSAASGVSGGPWRPVYVIGEVTGNASIGFPSIFGACGYGSPGFHWLTSPGIPMLPTGGTLTSGKAAWWFLIYTNGTALLMLDVDNGMATALGAIALTWATCMSNPLTLGTSGILDSTTALADVIASNASFFGGRSQLNGTMELYWGIRGTMPSVWPIWVATFTTCPFLTFHLAATYQNGTEYVEGLNATSGTPVPGGIHSGFGIAVPTVCSGPTNGA